MIGSTATRWDDMIDFKMSELESRVTAVASPFLFTEQHVFVLPVVLGGINVCTSRDVCTVGDEAIVEETTHRLLEPYVDQIGGFRRDIDSHPLTAQTFRSNASRRTSAERVKQCVARIRRGRNHAL